MLAFSCILGGDLMGQKTLPYSYGFEFTGTYNATNAAAALSTEGWTLTNASNNTYIRRYMYNNGYSFCFYVDESKDYQYLVSPLLSGASSLNIQFYWKTTSSTTVKYKIGYSTSDTPNVETNFTWSDTHTATWYSTYTLASESFSAEGIKYIAIQFDRNSDASTGHYFAIDDITISIVPPKNLVASPMTTLATLSWTDGSDESEWLLYYSTTNTAPTDYTTNVISVESNPIYTITGLTKDETYYAWVCAEDNGIYSAWVGPVEFTPSDEFTLTVNNGTATQTGAPFFYNTTNSNVKSQFIIPSTELTYLINKQITDLQFYHTVANQSWGDAKFEIYMKEFDSKTTFSSSNDYTDWSTMTKVYDGNAVFSTDGNKIMDIELTNPYVYTGGNLMVGFKIIATGSSLSSCYWYGVSQSAADNNTCICYTTYNTGYKWLPKITFTYQSITINDSTWGTGVTPTSTQNVEIKNDVTIADGTNATANIIEMSSGSTLTVEHGATLTCNNIIGATSSNFTIEDGGQLICNNAVNATVHKTIAAWDEGLTGGWYFIASPINVNNLAPINVTNMISDENAANGDRTYDLYSLDNITWHNYRANTFNLANGQGYLYASKDGADLQFSGAIKAYDANYTISVSQGWNLIGNPYTFEAYPNQAYYTINDANSGITAQTSTSSAVVAPCTGIIVKAAENGTVKFLKDAPETSANNGNLQMVLAHKVATRDGASVNKNIDNAIVSFNEGSQLEKFYFGNPSASIFIPQNGEDYAIAFSDRQGDVPLYFKANETGTYTISFAGDEMSLNGIYLIDILAEEEIDLSVNPSYTFIGSPADRMARFKIVFRNANGDGTSDIFAYQSGNDIIVSGEGELQIFDVMGRMVSRQRVNGVETVNAMPYGVYILKLNGMTQKIVVR